jgi:hypothetical protein
MSCQLQNGWSEVAKLSTSRFACAGFAPRLNPSLQFRAGESDASAADANHGNFAGRS